MTIRRFSFLARPLVAACGLLLAALGSFAPSVWAQGTVILSGTTTNTCSYNSITTLPNGSVSVNCAAAANTATVTFGAVSGSLSTAAGPSNASLPVNCSGTCAGVAVALSVTSPASGVIATPTISFAGAGTLTAIVNGTGPLTAGNAVVSLSVTAAGSGVTTTPTLTTGSITANVPIVDASTPGTLAFSPTAAIAVEGGSIVTVNVTRTGSGASAGTVTVDYVCTATPTAPTAYLPAMTPGSSGTLTWNLADATAKPITINPTTVPGTTAGSVTCTLSNPTGSATASTTPYMLTVNKAATGSTCTTTADKNLDLSTGLLWRVIPEFAPNQTAAIKIKSAIGATTSFAINTTWPVPAKYAASGVQVNIAECPGDFTTSIAPVCGPTYKTSNKVDRISSLNRTESYYCDNLDPNKTYYFNIRYQSPSTGATTCPYANCTVYVDLSPQ